MATTEPQMVRSRSSYFDSYTDPKVHEVMLSDQPRMTAYRTFFEEFKHLIQGKVVMDVGAGTGILSLWAASVGAQKVYAVEASPVATICKEIVEQNGFQDKIVVVNSTVEDAKLEDGMKVDVIVSEWMGFYLLHESMLDSVIVARDKFLAAGGIVIPAIARLYAAPVNLEAYLEEKCEFWRNVAGFDFSAVIPLVRSKLLEEPLTTVVTQQQLATPPQLLKEFDLQTVSVLDVQEVTNYFQFSFDKDVTVHGVALWFDVDFKPGGSSRGVEDWNVKLPTVLNTSPAHPPTHWKQTVILFPVDVPGTPAEALGCVVSLAQDAEDKRHYNITLELTGGDGDQSASEEEDEEDHPVPCDCGRGKCELIKAVIAQYNEDQDAQTDQ